MEFMDVIKQWNDGADENNQWPELDSLEQVTHFHTTLTQRIAELETALKYVCKINGGYCDTGFVDGEGCSGCHIEKICTESLTQGEDN